MQSQLPAPQAAPKASPADRWSAAGPMRMGFLSLFVLIFGLGGWSAFASISGAVVASGRVKVETNQQVVQHADGGIVAELLVTEGDRVEAGDMLIRLDDRLLRAELAILEGQLYEILARIGRLEAEQEGSDEIAFDPELLEVAARRPDVAALAAGQQRLFETRADLMRRQVEQLRERQTQIEDEIEGTGAQMTALELQLGFIDHELRDQRDLLAKGLTQTTRVLALERENARLTGEFGALLAQTAQARGRITEIDIQIIALEAQRREEAISELRDLRSREAELKEQRLSRIEVLSRLDIRAPRAGVILNQTVFTPRAVIRPAEPILYIVPTEAALVVEVRFEPTQIDNVYVGQPARLRFSAFNQRTTPEIPGRIRRVSPDATVDQQTGMSYYTAEIAIEEEGAAMLEGLTLQAGMPVEAFITTGERTPISYLIQPMTDFFARSMTEN
jgi:HlyD family secretion protein